MPPEPCGVVGSPPPYAVSNRLQALGGCELGLRRVEVRTGHVPRLEGCISYRFALSLVVDEPTPLCTAVLLHPAGRWGSSRRSSSRGTKLGGLIRLAALPSTRRLRPLAGTIADELRFAIDVHGVMVGGMGHQP